MVTQIQNYHQEIIVLNTINFFVETDIFGLLFFSYFGNIHMETSYCIWLMYNLTYETYF